MKKAIAYIRISNKDQSNFSISGQTEMITTHCQRLSWDVAATFIDDGKSAKNFDRPDWKKLQAFVKQNHREVDYLLVCKYDRFSRNTSEALQMLDLIEKKYGIRVLSVMEPIHVHPESPFFFQIRTQILTNAQVEWLIIRDRTRFGNHYAAKAGRFITTAPFGYKNARDSSNKPILVMDEAKASVVKMMYDMLLQGASQKEIKLSASRKGYKNRGSSAVVETLRSPVYAGLVKVPAYGDQPEQLTKGLHQGIIDEATWWRAQELLQPRATRRTVMNEDVPLRAVLKCFCSRHLTAGKSKGKNRYYWYYKCDSHKKYNLNADKLHAQLEAILDELSLSPIHIDYLKEKINERLQNELNDQEALLQEKKRDLAGLQVKLDNVEEKFINDHLDVAAYKKWKARYQKEISFAQRDLLELSTPINEVISTYTAELHKLTNLKYLYNCADLHQKQAFVRLVFKSELYYQDGVYRTPYILPIFQQKALSLKEKGLLEIEQPIKKSAEMQECAPERT